MVLRFAIAGAITGYQRYLSPHKGFCCAHHTLHGRGSCSSWGKRVVLKHGLLLFSPLMVRRFRSCAAAYVTLMTAQQDGTAPPSNTEEEYKDCPCFSKGCGRYGTAVDSACIVLPIPCDIFGLFG